MALFNPDDFSRFVNFDIHHTTYKTVSGHAIGVHVLIPKSLTSDAAASEQQQQQQQQQRRPVILRFHGGGLIGASSLFPEFVAPWLLQLAERHSAVIISPDYRLLPESPIEDIVEDTDDALRWTRADLPAFVRGQTGGRVDVDTDRLLACGESAGGYLGLLTALNHPGEVRAATAAYPMVDVAAPFFTQDYEKSVFGLPRIPHSVVDEHLARVKRGDAPSVVSSDPRYARGELMFSYFQRGLFGDVFTADNPQVQILDRLRAGARFPRGGVFVFHGRGDSVVPVEGSLKLAEVVKEVQPDLKFHLELRDGEHGFDLGVTLEEEWVANGLRDVVAAWLAEA